MAAANAVTRATWANDWALGSKGRVYEDMGFGVPLSVHRPLLSAQVYQRIPNQRYSG